MEPYSADKIKRKKRKTYDHKDEIVPTTTHPVIPFNLINRKGIDIYEGSEKIPFKKRERDFQSILRDEFE